MPNSYRYVVCKCFHSFHPRKFFFRLLYVDQSVKWSLHQYCTFLGLLTSILLKFIGHKYVFFLVIFQKINFLIFYFLYLLLIFSIQVSCLFLFICTISLHHQHNNSGVQIYNIKPLLRVSKMYFIIFAYDSACFVSSLEKIQLSEILKHFLYFLRNSKILVSHLYFQSVCN